ncbi:hypothetical protein QFZ32_007826 [Streptomyces canus]|nr:hypothetical protein [Streptomyces canus]
MTTGSFGGPAAAVAAHLTAADHGRPCRFAARAGLLLRDVRTGADSRTRSVRRLRVR